MSKTTDLSRWTAKTQGEASAVLGIGERTFSRWIKAGCPGRPGAYPLPDIIEWARQTQWEVRQTGTDDDPAMAGGDSPALERYRAARAAQEEMKLDQMRKALVPMQEVSWFMQSFTITWRGISEQLCREFGQEARAIISAELDQFKREIYDRYGIESEEPISQEARDQFPAPQTSV